MQKIKFARREVIMGQAKEIAPLFSKSKWIWSDDADTVNSHIIFRRTFSFGTERPPMRALCRVACEGHYYFFVNGTPVVWDGGLNRGKHLFYDEFDIGKQLVKGDNVIVAYCQYAGNSGRDAVAGNRAGFIFECTDLDIYSDEKFIYYANPAYKMPRVTNCFYAGWSVDYDASLEGQIQNFLDPAFNSSLFRPSAVIGEYNDDDYGELLPRPVPLWKFSVQPVFAKVKKSADKFADDVYIVNLPRTMRFTPYMEITGNGQEKVTIVTDMTDCHGSFGDDDSIYTAHRIEYTTKPTVNIFDGMLPMTGRTVRFSMPRTVKVLKLGYRELGYDTAPTCDFLPDDDTLKSLYLTAEHTLYNCLGSTVMDTPERERAMWLGDASIAARALYIAFSDAGCLVRKVIDDIMEWREGDVLMGCVPGNVPVDIPAHGLLALSEFGIFAQYRNYVDDYAIFRMYYEKLCDYLMLWGMTENGVVPRDGTRRWFDNLYNIDEPLVENALYYSACKFLKDIGAEIGITEYAEDLDDRMENIAGYIARTWDGVGYTTLGTCYDDRANALIVLCGLVPEERKSAITRILGGTLNASPYMEWAALEALVALGRTDLAYDRFISRYAPAVNKNADTLGEDFNSCYGSKCQAYQAAVIFECVQLFGGVDVRGGGKKVTISPDLRVMDGLRLTLKVADGIIDLRYKKSDARVDLLIDNRTSADVTLAINPERIGCNVEKRAIKLGRGKNKFSL